MKLFYLLFSASLYVLSYSPFDYKPLIFLSLVIFLVVIENLSLKEKIKHTFFYALLIHALGASWVSESLITYGFMGLTSSILITLLFVIAISIPYIIIALFHRPIQKNNIYNINLIAVLFLTAEYVKSLFFGGFPWLLVGISQNETIFNFIYPVFGSYMVTYIVVLSAALFYKTIYIKRGKYITISIILASTYLSGYLFSINNETHDGENISFSLYQPNIYPDRVYNPHEYKKIINSYKY